MFGKKVDGAEKTVFETDIELGEMYREKSSGLEGKATSVHFYEYACERVSLRYVDKDGNIQSASFDAPELEHVATQTTPRVKRSGGPARSEGARRDVPMAR